MIKKSILFLFSFIVLFANTIGQIHAITHSDYKEDATFKCHNKHIEEHHHHCELDNLFFDFLKPKTIYVNFFKLLVNVPAKITKSNFCVIIIHYFFSIKAPPINIT